MRPSGSRPLTGCLGFVCLALSVVSFVWLLIMGVLWCRWLLDNELRGGVRTQAQVDSVRARQQSFVKYSYAVEGKTYQGSCDVSLSTARAILKLRRKQRLIEVAYSARRPERSKPAESLAERPLRQTGMALLWSLGSLTAFWVWIQIGGLSLLEAQYRGTRSHDGGWSEVGPDASA